MDYQNDPPIPQHEEPYGFMERELIFKLLASHALVDAEFFDELRYRPVEAARQLHIRLTDADLAYLQDSVDWDTIARSADEIRESLKLELVTNSW